MKRKYLEAFKCLLDYSILIGDLKTLREEKISFYSKYNIFFFRYTGHIHQLRFRQGHTYGEETHRLSNDFPHLLKHSRSVVVKYEQPNPYLTREFPDGLIPGYTGNNKIPLFSTRFGQLFLYIRLCSSTKISTW